MIYGLAEKELYPFYIVYPGLRIGTTDSIELSEEEAEELRELQENLIKWQKRFAKVVWPDAPFNGEDDYKIVEE